VDIVFMAQCRMTGTASVLWVTAGGFSKRRNFGGSEQWNSSSMG
jgi:hypothetical protein